MPWDKASIVAKESLPVGKVWSHLLFAHRYDFKYAVKALDDVFGADQGYKDPQSEVVALYALKLAHTGVMVAGSLVLSTAAWLLARVRVGEDWTRSFDETQDKVRAVTAEHLSGAVTSDKISRITNWIITYFGLREFFAGQKTFHRFRSKPIKPTQVETDDDPLNCFILDDLADVADNLERGVSSTPLDAYLTHHTKDGRIRLITTNFGRLFEEVIATEPYPVNPFQAPLLSVPKNRWDGLVYLHGLLSKDPTASELDRLVISSGDFGLAYLTERWAARFVSELFRNYTVCFVGYSIADPVLRYMMDALAADRLLAAASRCSRCQV